ncbi:MAG: hypothetical protein IPJ24_17210 [bacterium]|nr:hypothetical protein [bacterium]
MNDQLEFLGFVVRRLDAARVPYMLTGSVAMSLYTQPRMTRDIDLVVECASTNAADWVRLFGAECYVSAEAVADAIARGGMFNVIHNEGVAKADFIVRRDDEYRQVEFARRQRKHIAGLEVSVVAREDLVLSKLVWWKEGESPQQRADLVLLLESTAGMDLNYLEDWAARLGVVAQLRELLG